MTLVLIRVEVLFFILLVLMWVCFSRDMSPVSQTILQHSALSVNRGSCIWYKTKCSSATGQKSRKWPRAGGGNGNLKAEKDMKGRRGGQRSLAKDSKSAQRIAVLWGMQAHLEDHARVPTGLKTDRSPCREPNGQPVPPGSFGWDNLTSAAHAKTDFQAAVRRFFYSSSPGNGGTSGHAAKKASKSCWRPAAASRRRWSSEAITEYFSAIALAANCLIE